MLFEKTCFVNKNFTMFVRGKKIYFGESDMSKNEI